ncbi:MAG: cytochrome b/b6 domain-containing protein [Rhodospirillaceae bacterium]
MTAQTEPANSEKTESPGVPVWDVGVRLFHWLFVAAVTFSIATGLTGGLWQMDWHMRSGYLIVGLIIFRLIWGVAGGRHARFVNFLKGPVTVIRYAVDFIRRCDAHTTGHNPLGGWSVVLILLAVGAQAGTGLFANDDIFIKGPLADLVGKDMSDVLTAWHLSLKYLVWGLIALHLSAIAAHWLRGENLVPPMLHGRKTGIDPATADGGPRWISLALAAIVAAALVYWILSLGVVAE